MPILAGREFTEHDDANSTPVMVVNQTLVKRYMQGRDPIGQKIRAWGLTFTVVGLVKDSKYRTMNEAANAVFLRAVPADLSAASPATTGASVSMSAPSSDPASGTALLRRRGVGNRPGRRRL